MNSIKKNILVILSVCALGASSIAFAQTTQNSASQEIQADTQVTAQDLGISEPTILPNSPFYFIKEWGRGITSFFTFDATKKAELANKYANEKLIELQKLAEKNASAKDVKDAVANYQNSIDDLKNKIGQIRDKSTNNQELTNFLTDFAKQQILQEKALRTMITDQVSTDVSNTVKNAQDLQIKNFGTIVSGLEQQKQDVKKQILEGLKSLPGSQFKDFSNLELLNNIEQNATGTTGQTIQSIKDAIQQNLQDSLKSLPLSEQKKIADYLQNVPGEREIYTNVLKNVSPAIKGYPELTKNLINIQLDLQKSILENTQKTIENTNGNVQQQIEQNQQDLRKTIEDNTQKILQGTIEQLNGGGTQEPPTPADKRE
jgi:hypothetical protein